MVPNKEVIEESTVIIDEIESNLADLVTKKRQGVERDYQELVRKEKEESDRKISTLEREFAHDKALLGEFRSSLAEYERERQDLRSEIKTRLDKAGGFQKEIERLAGLTMEELKIVDELGAKLAEVRRVSNERIAELRTRIQERFGLKLSGGEPTGVPEPPSAEERGARPQKSVVEPSPAKEPPIPEPVPRAIPEERTAPDRARAEERPVAEERTVPVPTPEQASEIVTDLELELRKLKRIKQLLENEGKPDSESHANGTLRDPSLGRLLNPELPPLPEEPEEPFEEPTTVPEPAADFKMPEINQFIEDFAKRPPEPVPLRPEETASKREAPPAPKNGLSFQAVFEALEQYRKTETFDDANEISYFQKDGRTILDVESILRSMDQILDNVRKISGRMSQASSPKDQFFMKQELVNQQGVLRKIVLRGVKLCENEAAVLPSFTERAMSLPVLREILEKLTMGNWSDTESLAAFDAQVSRLKESFYQLITPPANYLRSILDELAG